MPTRFLSDAELAQLAGFPADIAAEDLVTYFTLEADDARWAMRDHRGAANRLGLALQLCSLRWLGFVPDDLTSAPPAAVARLAGQLGVDPSVLADYGGWQERTRTEHLREVLDRLGWATAGPSEVKALGGLPGRAGVEARLADSAGAPGVRASPLSSGGPPRPRPPAALGGDISRAGRDHDRHAAGPTAQRRAPKPAEPPGGDRCRPGHEPAGLAATRCHLGRGRGHQGRAGQARLPTLPRRRPPRPVGAPPGPAAVPGPDRPSLHRPSPGPGRSPSSPSGPVGHHRRGRRGGPRRAVLLFD